MNKPPIDAINERLLTPDEAAEVVRKKPRTVRDWMNSGKLEAIKLNGQWLTSLEAVQRMIEAQAVTNV